MKWHTCKAIGKPSVQWEEINGRKYTHLLYKCSKCGNYWVRTLVGDWEPESFDLIEDESEASRG